MTTTVLALALALGGVACESDSPAEPDYTDSPPSPGSGTATLMVVVEVEGHSVNGVVTETSFSATVTDTSGAPVSGTVVVSGRFGDLLLAEGATGSYSAVEAGYETGSYTLEVTAGADNVTGVTVTAPAVHSINTPSAGDTVTANTAINVRWSRADIASECRLETLDYDSDWIYGDPGTLFMPTIANPPRTDQRISISRRNYQVPQGALFGSRFSVDIRSTVDPIVAD